MTKRFLILFTSLVGFTFCVFAQLPISISGGLSGGLLFPQSSSMKGDLLDDHNYPLSKTGYSFEGKVRIAFPLLPVRIVGMFSYISLSNDSTLGIYGPNGLVTSQYTYSLSIITTGIGVEYSFLTFPIIKPYLGSDIVANFYSGSGGNNQIFFPDAKLASTNRFGINVGVGTLVEIPLFPISFDLELKYCFSNVIGKTFTSTIYPFGGYGGLPQNSIYYLNDAKNPNDSNDHNRAINYLVLKVGVVFTII